MKLGLNGNFPYRLLIIAEKYLLIKHIVLYIILYEYLEFITVLETGETACQDSNLLVDTSSLDIT